MSDFEEADVCETCGEDWCTCDDDGELEAELEKQDTGMV
jgi:hypothetical protein